MAVSKYGVEIPDDRPWLCNVAYRVGQKEPPPPELVEAIFKGLKSIEESLGCKIERVNPHAG